MSRGDSSASVETNGTDVMDALNRGMTTRAELQKIEEEALAVQRSAVRAAEADQAAGLDHQETQLVDCADLDALADELGRLLQPSTDENAKLEEAHSQRASTPPHSRTDDEHALSPGWFRSPRRPDPLTEELNQHWAFRRGKSTEDLAHHQPEIAEQPPKHPEHTAAMNTQQDGSAHQQTSGHPQQAASMDTLQDGSAREQTPKHPKHTAAMNTQQDGSAHQQTSGHPHQAAIMDTLQDGSAREQTPKHPEHTAAMNTQQDGNVHQQTSKHPQQAAIMDTRQDGSVHEQVPKHPQQGTTTDTEQDGNARWQTPKHPQQTAMDTHAQDGSAPQQTPGHPQLTAMDTQVQDGSAPQQTPGHPQQTAMDIHSQDGSARQQTPGQPQQTATMDTQVPDSHGNTHQAKVPQQSTSTDSSMSQDHEAASATDQQQTTANPAEQPVTKAPSSTGLHEEGDAPAVTAAPVIIKQEPNETGPDDQKPEGNKWRCDKYGRPLRPAALYSRFYRSIRSQGPIFAFSSTTIFDPLML